MLPTLSRRVVLALIATVTFTVSAVQAADPHRVRLRTNVGDVIIELNAEKAPKTVENFLKYVIDGFYDGTVFHRTIPNFMIQGGGYTTDLQRKRTDPPVENEADNGLTNVRGSVAMARTSDPNSATAQFFINVVDNGFLDHKAKDQRGWGYAVFGRVVEGMEVVDTIRAVRTVRKGPFANLPSENIIIESATVVGQQ